MGGWEGGSMNEKKRMNEGRREEDGWNEERIKRRMEN